MKLDDWLWANKTRRNAFAKMIGVSNGYVTYLCSGRAQPSLELAQKIAAVTNGKVAPEDFFHEQLSEGGEI